MVAVLYIFLFLGRAWAARSDTKTLGFYQSNPFVFKDVFLNLRGWWLYVDMLEQWSRIKRHLGMDAPYSLPTFHSLLQTFNDVPRKFSENPTTRSLQEWIDIGIVRPRLFPACRSNCETSKQPIMHCRWAGCFQFFLLSSRT